MGGACYNAVLSVNLNELDYIDNVTITNSSTTLTTTGNIADNIFGIGIDPTTGVATIMKQPDETNVETIQDDINNQILQNQKRIDDLRAKNPNTKLSDKQLVDLYNDFNSGGFIII